MAFRIPEPPTTERVLRSLSPFGAPLRASSGQIFINCFTYNKPMPAMGDKDPYEQGKVRRRGAHLSRGLALGRCWWCRQGRLV